MGRLNTAQRGGNSSAPGSDHLGVMVCAGSVGAGQPESRPFSMATDVT
jgi:hypothetical protein